MTPGARVAAAAEILDTWQGGMPAERALTRWARGHRFAGSKDRAAIRDHVYGALRRLRSAAAIGGGTDGRALMLGLLRFEGTDPGTVFTGQGHAPAPLDPAEAASGRAPAAGAEALDMPDWLYARLSEGLGEACDAVCAALRHRAPVHLRVNLARASRAEAAAALAAEGIATAPHRLSPSALEVRAGERALRSAAPVVDGRVEFQDAASQAVADMVPLRDGDRVLDHCAGGGGKALALAARARIALFTHDAEARRMVDLPMRARRAGAAIQCLDPGRAAEAAPYDAVLVDAPCSGSGAWRRDPEGKWRLTPARLSDLEALQARLLIEASDLVAPAGALVYATCSLLRSENADQISRFVSAAPHWQVEHQRVFLPSHGGDGFFCAVLRRKPLCLPCNLP